MATVPHAEDFVLRRESECRFVLRFQPLEPYVYGIHRCLLVVFGRGKSWSVSHYINLEVRSKGINLAAHVYISPPILVCYRAGGDSAVVTQVSHEDDLKMLAPTSAYQPKVIDDVQRTVIPAFPPERASKSHLHTKVETNWVEALDEYPIPQDLQVSLFSFLVPPVAAAAAACVGTFSLASLLLLSPVCG